ncbi:hypothetical protein B14911_27605 [Bacillus sp. NRRL B-14911]|nr:hypothetical protein B14911_27605 [Bacillus sp. NRRL B-14911]OXT14822.1 hypothetical protein B9K06_24380 [Bacillus sp. OG2]
MLSFPALLSPSAANIRHISAAQQTPAYAKWGKLAMTNTKIKYPGARILDYLHVGRTTQGSNCTETFKLWLARDNREFGVFVRITFDEKTEKIRAITYQETPR